MSARLCPICGTHAGACNSPSKGGGIIYKRLEPGEVTAMPKILVANRTYYFTEDYTQVVERGDPRARYLCARKDTPVDADVAARFGLDVRDATAVSVVPQAMPSTEGVSPEVAAGYARMAATRAANEAQRETNELHRSGHTSRQRAAMVHGAVNEAIGATTDAPDEPGRLRTADSRGGQTGKPISEDVGSETLRDRITHAIEDVSPRATAPTAQDIRDASARAPEPRSAQPEPTGARTRTVDIGGEQPQPGGVPKAQERDRAELEADNRAAETRGEPPPHQIPRTRAEIEADEAADETRKRGGGEEGGADVPLAGVPVNRAEGTGEERKSPILLGASTTEERPNGETTGITMSDVEATDTGRPTAGEGEGATLSEALKDSPSVGAESRPGEVTEASPRAPQETELKSPTD